MPSTPLLERIQTDYPNILFKPGERFEWRPETRTIVYDSEDTYFNAHLLHELGHALLSHNHYKRDIDLIAMERDAWQMAKVGLAQGYDTSVTSDVIDHDMDTYRDWLHSRSTCPRCQSNGLQTASREYKCVTCLKKWRVNEARSCQLRRYRI